MVKVLICLVFCSFGFSAAAAKTNLIPTNNTVSCAGLDDDQCAEKVVLQSDFFAYLLKANGITALSQPIQTMTIHAFGDGGEIWTTHVMAINLGEDSFSNVQLFQVNLDVFDYDDYTGRREATDSSTIVPISLQEN